MPLDPSVPPTLSARTPSPLATTTPKSATYAVHLSPSYTIGSVPHGGYVTSTIQSALTHHIQANHPTLHQPHLLSLHLSFLRRTSTGPAFITITDSKVGRGTSTFHISLSQAQKRKNAVDVQREEVVGYLTHTDLLSPSSASGPSFVTPWKLTPPPRPRPESWTAVAQGKDSYWALQPRLPFSGFRKASQAVRWVLPRKRPGSPAAVGMQDQWMGLNTVVDAQGSHERWTNMKLGFVVDMFPQLIETFLTPDVYLAESQEDHSQHSKPDSRRRTAVQHNRPNPDPGAKFWYPTVTLAMEVKKALPPEGVEWLFLRVTTKQVKDGRYDLEVVVMDEEGELVALSQHVCFAVGAERNLSARGDGGLEGVAKL